MVDGLNAIGHRACHRQPWQRLWPRTPG